jgi:hypothetical protein
MDGTGVPVRRNELVDRKGKQPDGSAKTREVKLCTVWSAEGRDKQGVSMRDEGSITYSAAIEIVDRFHAKQYLSNVSKAIFGAGSDLAKAWVKQRHDELDEGRLDDLLCAVETHASVCEEARKCCGYIAENRERMRYPEFHAQSLCTSTGVVEAGCKLAIGTRLKRAGMHWSVRGADAIIALRCSKLSGRFEDFWERRAERAAARHATSTAAA